MHVGLLTVDGTKMSKSLGNFLTIEDALKRFGPELIRYVFLVHNYRSNVNLADQVFSENLNGLWDFYRTLELVKLSGGTGQGEFESVKALVSSFEKAMNDDFNAPLAMVALRKGLGELRKLLGQPPTAEAISLSETIAQLGKVLGLFQFNVSEVLEQGLRFSARIKGCEQPEIKALTALLERREEARGAKNFQESDRIRDQLKVYGLEYLDSKGIKLSGENLLLNLRFLA